MGSFEKQTYGKPADDRVGNISNTRLEWQEVVWQPAMLDFMLEEFDQIGSNSSRSVVLWSIGLRLIRII